MSCIQGAGGEGCLLGGRGGVKKRCLGSWWGREVKGVHQRKEGMRGLTKRVSQCGGGGKKDVRQDGGVSERAGGETSC